jgi:hypothetical protein
VYSPACSGIRRPEADVAGDTSSNLDAGAKATATAVLPGKSAPTADSREGPVVPKPQTHRPFDPLPRTIVSREGDEKQATAVARAENLSKGGDALKSTVVPTPQTPNPTDSQAFDSRLGVPEAHQSPDPV